MKIKLKLGLMVCMLLSSGYMATRALGTITPHKSVPEPDAAVYADFAANADAVPTVASTAMPTGLRRFFLGTAGFFSVLSLISASTPPIYRKNISNYHDSILRIMIITHYVNQ